MKLDAIQNVIPQQVQSGINWAVIVGAPVASFLSVVNPILQAISFIVAIAWGSVQLWSWWKKRRG